MTDAEITDFLREAISGLVAVYRFGSTVAQRTHAQSDIDIAFLAATRIDPVDRFALQEKLASRVGRDVDLLDLQTASTVMRMQVISNGHVLATYDTKAREAFEDHAYTSYARLNEERREILDQVRREGRVYGG
jgi:predicted nucleotidyltransferase